MNSITPPLGAPSLTHFLIPLTSNVGDGLWPNQLVFKQPLSLPQLQVGLKAARQERRLIEAERTRNKGNHLQVQAWIIWLISPAHIPMLNNTG